jgi:hypothetical protein
MWIADAQSIRAERVTDSGLVPCLVDCRKIRRVGIRAGTSDGIHIHTSVWCGRWEYIVDDARPADLIALLGWKTGQYWRDSVPHRGCGTEDGGLMRIPASAVYVCTFPDFDTADRVEIDAPEPRQAAIKAAGWWEEAIDDYRVLRGEETLRVQVQAGEADSKWEVLGERGRYVAKAMEKP